MLYKRIIIQLYKKQTKLYQPIAFSIVNDFHLLSINPSYEPTSTLHFHRSVFSALFLKYDRKWQINL